MGKKNITLELTARNRLAAGLSKARKSLATFGKSAARIGKAFVKGFLIAGAALIAFSTKALTAYAAQEKAEKAVVATLNAHGEAGEKILPTLKKVAAAIQDETGAADENTLQLMSNLRSLGVQTSQLERAAKGTVALTRVGLGLETAQKAMAAALQGDFMQLTRYVPALRSATSETEKAQIVNDLLVKGYAAQTEELDTVAGRWTALKGRVGDAWEAIGAAAAGNGNLTRTLDTAGESVKAFGERVADWVAAGGFQKFQATARFVLDDTMARVQWFADSTMAVFTNMSKIVTNIWQNTTDSIGHFLAKTLAKVTGQKWNIPAPDMRDVMAGVKELPEKGEAAYAKYQARLAEIDKDIADSAKKANADRVASTVSAVDNIITIEEQGLGSIKKLKKEQAALAKEQAALAKQVANAEKKAAQEKIQAIQKEIAKRQELAKKTVKAFMDQKNAEKAAADALKADADKADKLRAKQARGIKLSKKDRKFLEAFGEIEAAQNAIKPGVPGNLANQLANAKANLANLKDQAKTLKEIKTELATMNKDLGKLLRQA